jgi:UDP-3-O-[3-hydroxymyristoyl] glucosamine N-acyltransferase
MHDLQAIISTLNPKEVIGSISKQICEPISLEPTNERDDVIMWANPAYYEQLMGLRCGVVICKLIEPQHVQSTCTYLIVENPRRAFAQVLKEFFLPQPTFEISATAQLASNVKLGEFASIGEYVVIEKDCVLGDYVTLDHHTVLKQGTMLGSRVRIGANSVIGSRGFGYERDEHGDYQPIPHLGNVVIGDNVEIGACSSIDRAVMGSTQIGDNVKIDNNVQVGHGVKIGRNTLIIANSVIGGSTHIGENVWISPGVSVINKVSVGDHTTLGLGTVVVKDVESRVVVFGNPARIIGKVE